VNRHIYIEKLDRSYYWGVRVGGRPVGYQVPSGGVGYPSEDAAYAAARDAGWKWSENGSVFYDGPMPSF
jgi:hypothetical protein